MRILAAADIHGVTVLYEWLAELARISRADAVVLAGDLLPSDFPAKQRTYAERITKILRRIDSPVLYIMGNDDNIPLAADDHHFVPIHGKSIQLGGYNFVGYQYTPPFVGDAFVKPDDEIASDLLSLEPIIDDRTVLVTHTPAWGSLDLSSDENVGSRAVVGMLARRTALAHIHGHVHGQFGRLGNHFNVASAGLCRAMLIDLATLHHAVVAHSDTSLPCVIAKAVERISSH